MRHFFAVHFLQRFFTVLPYCTSSSIHVYFMYTFILLYSLKSFSLSFFSVFFSLLFFNVVAVVGVVVVIIFEARAIQKYVFASCAFFYFFNFFSNEKYLCNVINREFMNYTFFFPKAASIENVRIFWGEAKRKKNLSFSDYLRRLNCCVGCYRHLTSSVPGHALNPPHSNRIHSRIQSMHRELLVNLNEPQVFVVRKIP